MTTQHLPKVSPLIAEIDLTKVEVVHISKKWDTGLFMWWYHVSIDYVKVTIVPVNGPEGAAVEKMIANPPQGKRFAVTNYPNATSWDLVDLPPQVETPEPQVETEIDPESVEWFHFFTRNHDGQVFNAYQTWDHLEVVKADPTVKSWQVSKVDGADMWMIAQSVNFSSVSVSEVMGKRHTEVARVVDGLLVEERSNKTQIYFGVLRHSYSPYIEIVTNPLGNKTMAVIGSVSNYNIEGFNKAVKLATSLL